MNQGSFQSADEAHRHFERQYLRFALALVAELALVIAVPAAVAARLGLYLDSRHGSGPLWLVVCLLLAAGLSAFFIYRRSRRFTALHRAIAEAERAALADLESEPS